MALYQNEGGKWVFDEKGKSSVGRVAFSSNQSGWVCPKCGRIWAPWVHECVLCNLSSKQREKDIIE